ncbi:hypothetical protein [Castellaniella sp.]|uniref:hypothetical protein n=1 Tax=Castellaniella sp. TaxID=1955812 RepID=UPI002AFFD2EC|nr:hypothetical protein [Castellaniella sp.]
MKSQEIFNRVLTHLRKQGRVSMKFTPGHGITCAYRGYAGSMCAVGCLISDEAYDPDFEGESVNGERVEAALKASIGRVTERQFDLLLRLQTAHDDYIAKGMGEWEKQMQQIANQFNLKYAPPA